MEPVKDENGIWKCPICGWTAMSRKVVEQHILNTHSEEMNKRKHEKAKQDMKKQKKKHRNVQSIEFKYFENKDVVVVLKNGTIIEGKFVAETAYNFVLKDAIIKGSKHIAEVELLVVAKSSYSLLHFPPKKLEEVNIGDVKDK